LGSYNDWISIDETTDCEGRYVANVIVGTLEIKRPSQIFLLHSEALDKATVLKKKPGYTTTKTISKILEGEIDGNNELFEYLNASDIACMKYAPINTRAKFFNVYKCTNR